jgi:HPt (histidine-containing phosphotransfer) domain-containing protein
VSNLTSLQNQEDVPLQSSGTFYISPQQPLEVEANSLTDIDEVLNEQWVIEYFGNDYSIAIPILQLFIEDALPELDQLETVLRKHGAQELRKKIHKINPSFKMVGQVALAQSLTELEDSCITADDIDELKFKIKKIQTHARRLKPLILKQYNSISKLHSI